MDMYEEKKVTATPLEESDEDIKDKAFEDAISTDALRKAYKSGDLKLTKDEDDMVGFCHKTDMMSFLRKEFNKNPTPDFEEE